jgi:hypothetical protein
MVMTQLGQHEYSHCQARYRTVIWARVDNNLNVKPNRRHSTLCLCIMAHETLWAISRSYGLAKKVIWLARKCDLAPHTRVAP